MFHSRHIFRTFGYKRALVNPNYTRPLEAKGCVRYSSSGHSQGKGKSKSSPRYLRSLKYGGVLGVGFAVAYMSSEEIRNKTRHFLLLGERVGVVTVATIRCFGLYKDVLGRTFETEKDRNAALSATHKNAAEITLKALETNGGIYIKLGQHISALGYLLPREWVETMIPLQDRCPQSSMDEIAALFQRDMGKLLDEIFSEFNPEPIGVASLAQVHVARLRENGQKVAVKVQHPSLEEFVPVDVYLTQKVFNLMYRIFPEYPLTWLGDELQNSIFVELNFSEEAKNARNTAEYFKNYQKETALSIPKVTHAYPRILIMEHLAGARLDDLEYLRLNNINAADVSSCLSHIFNRMIFAPDVGLHCDPHGGNLAIRKLDKKRDGHNFEIILYDHGLYRKIPLQMKRDYAHFWLSVLDNDVENMRKYAEKVAGVKGDQKFKIFASAITGREPETALNYDISKTRSETEVRKMQLHLEENGVLEDLMDLLSNMPRIILLILKTNDLTRALDENLNNPLGPERTFLILANYCASTVYEEDKETINKKYSKLSFSWIFHQFRSWFYYKKRTSSLFIYDFFMIIHNLRSKIGL